MKKMLFALLFLVTISAYSQSQAVYVDTLANSADTLMIQPLFEKHDMLNFTVKNLSATACTLGIYTGYFIKNSSGVVYDTTWYQPPLKDSTFSGATSMIVAAGIGKTNSVLLLKPYPQIFKAWIKNTTGGNVQAILEGN